MKQAYKLLMGLAMLATVGFAGMNVFTTTPANAIMVALCQDGSFPINGQCPDVLETCDNVECPQGSECEIQNNAPICVAEEPTLTCANVLCNTGFQCVETQTGPQCQPDVTPTLTCANVLCTADSRCIETITGPRCIPVFTPPVYPTCAELACSGSSRCVTLAGRARCVPNSSGSGYSGTFNTFSTAINNFNQVVNGNANTGGSNTGSASGNGLNTFQNAQGNFNSIRQQQQNACIAAGRTWTGSFCKLW